MHEIMELDLEGALTKAMERECVRLKVILNVEPDDLIEALKREGKHPSQICRALADELVVWLSHRHDVRHESDRHGGLGWSSVKIQEWALKSLNRNLEEMIECMQAACRRKRARVASVAEDQ